MTEEEWLKCGDPGPMWRLLETSASWRKSRLFEIACCRDIWHLLTDAQSNAVVEVLEQYVEGNATDETLTRASCTACDVANEMDANLNSHTQESVDAARAAAAVGNPDVARLGFDGGPETASTFATYALADVAVPERWYGENEESWQNAQRAERRRQANYLRDIFGNPFHPVAFNPAWQSDTALTLTRQMYESRDFGAMPILADALQDARCEDEQILNHCRDANQPHVLGCWVCDLVLGKE